MLWESFRAILWGYRPDSRNANGFCSRLRPLAPVGPKIALALTGPIVESQLDCFSGKFIQLLETFKEMLPEEQFDKDV